MANNARLSANLQRAYTSFMTDGKTPVISSPRFDSEDFMLPPAPVVPPHATKSSPVDLVAPLRQTPILPDIVMPPGAHTGYRPSQIHRIDRVPTAAERVPTAAHRYTQSEDFAPAPQMSYGGDDMVYEYQVDDTAGIPSLGFFKKPYTMPTGRNGRIGGSWRHIRQCTSQGGGNLLFVEGGIKETDCKKYPPFGIQKSKTMYNEKGQRLVPKIAGTSTSRAKGGFEYWYKEPKANISAGH